MRKIALAKTHSVLNSIGCTFLSSTLFLSNPLFFPSKELKKVAKGQGYTFLFPFFSVKQCRIYSVFLIFTVNICFSNQFSFEFLIPLLTTIHLHLSFSLQESTRLKSPRAKPASFPRSPPHSFSLDGSLNSLFPPSSLQIFESRA